MKLPKELTTVTPFSKYFAMLLFILFPFLGFYLGMIYEQLIIRSKHIQTKQITTYTTTLSGYPTILPTYKFLGQVYWDVPQRSVPLSIEEELRIAFMSFDPKLTNGQRLAVVGIKISTVSANFGSASMQARDVNNKVIPTDGFEYLLSKKNGSWEITTEGAESFCNVLKSMPKDMLEGRLVYYSGCFVQGNTK